MNDYKTPRAPWNKDAANLDRSVNALSGFAAFAALVVLIGIMASSCVSGIVREVERQEEYEPRPRWASQTYSKPAAYRLSSPQQHEMDHLHGLMTVMEVNREVQVR